MTFKIEIELGNDAMQTADDVCSALRNFAGPEGWATVPYTMRDRGTIQDRNGNTVGKWTIGK